MLVIIEHISVVQFKTGILRFFAQEAVADRERLHLSAHEAAERVLGRAYQWFAPYVEAGVDEHRASRDRFECGQQRVIAAIALYHAGVHLFFEFLHFLTDEGWLS